jgi:hypothetical protein
MAELGKENARMQQCERCGGLFPGPGVEQQGKVYCCDMCTQGPKMMARMPMKTMARMPMMRFILAGIGLVGLVGFLLGLLVG